MKNEEQLSLFEKRKNFLKLDNVPNPIILKEFPFDSIYEVSKKEASRKKPIFFIHKYFARRTTCNFRLALLSSLSESNNIWDKFYSDAKTTSDKLTILDPFMGGGTTIFESLRVGANVIGNDLQPLSNLVTSAEVMPLNETKLTEAVNYLEDKVGSNIKEIYSTSCPCCDKEADVMYTFHVKQAKINKNVYDLFSSYVIASKGSDYTLVCPKCNNLNEHNFSDGASICSDCGHEIKSPKDGLISRGVFTSMDGKVSLALKELGKDSLYPHKTKMIAQEYYCNACEKHGYKRIENIDIQKELEANKKFEKLEKSLLIPTQMIPDGQNTNQMKNHGYQKFSDLFTKRQLLCLGMLLREIDVMGDEESKFWCLVAFSSILEMNNTFCRYQHNARKISNIFFNHAYVPIAMPVENNVWGSKLGTGTFLKSINKIIKGKKFNKDIYDISYSNGKSGKIFSNDVVEANPTSNIADLTPTSPLLLNQDSRNLSIIKDKTVDLILTDPPFGNNIMYSELIDFFHSWIYLTKTGKKLGFTTPLSPKEEEIVVNKHRNGTYFDYANGLSGVFKECHRTLKDQGLLVFTFHDSNIESWGAVLESLRHSKFEILAAYPIHSESRTGAHTSSKNSIVFDIFIVCKKQMDIKSDFYSVKDISIDSLALTNDIVKRLENVNAEITIKDIENIYISQFFKELFKCEEKSIPESKLIIKELKILLEELEEQLDSTIITNKRTGWWTQKHGKEYLDSLIKKLNN